LTFEGNTENKTTVTNTQIDLSTFERTAVNSATVAFSLALRHVKRRTGLFKEHLPPLGELNNLAGCLPDDKV